MKLFKQMKNSSNLPVMTTNTALKGTLQEANMTTYTNVIHGLCKEGTLQEANRLLHVILKKIWHVTMIYSAANNSLWKNIAEMHSSSEWIAVDEVQSDFVIDALGKLSETGLVAEVAAVI